MNIVGIKPFLADNPGLRGVSRCARRVTVQVAQHGLRLRRIDSRLDTAKYAQTVTSTWTTPIRCSFWGDERRFHTAWVNSGGRSPRKPWSGLPPKADTPTASAYFGSGPLADNRRLFPLYASNP